MRRILGLVAALLAGLAIAVSAQIDTTPKLGVFRPNTYSPSLPSAYVSATSLTYNVKDYGAKGDGVTDDAAAIQSAINAAMTTATIRVGKGKVYLPAGIYRVNTELVVRNVNGFFLTGDGPINTTILGGATMTNILNVDGAAFSRFENFALTVASGFTITNLVLLHWSTLSPQRNPTGDIFVHLYLGITNRFTGATPQFVNGIAVGTDTTANKPANAIDGIEFNRVRVSGYWTAGSSNWRNGFLLGNGIFSNCLDEVFLNTEVIRMANGYNLNGCTGELFGGQTEKDSLDFLVANPPGQLKISGWRSEGAQGFFSLPAGAGQSALVDIDDILFYGDLLSLAQTYPIIVSKWAGRITIHNFEVRNVASASAVTTVNITGNVTVVVDGFGAPNSQTVAQTFTGSGGSVVFLLRAFFSQAFRTNVVTSTVPWQVFNPYRSGTPTMAALVTNQGLALGLIQPSEGVLVSGVDARGGNTIITTVTAARVVGNPLNSTVGQQLTYTFIQGGAGGFKIAWGSAFKGLTWSNAGNAVNTKSSITFTYDGVNWNQISAQTPWAL